MDPVAPSASVSDNEPSPAVQPGGAQDLGPGQPDVAHHGDAVQLGRGDRFLGRHGTKTAGEGGGDQERKQADAHARE